MAKKFRKLFIPILLLFLLALALGACTQRNIVALRLDGNAQYKSLYLLGEPFDPAGVTLIAQYDDESNAEIQLSEVWDEVRVTGFDSSSIGRRVAIIHYRRATVEFPYGVFEDLGGDTTFPVHFSVGEEGNGATPVDDIQVGLYDFIPQPDPAPTRDGYAFDGWYKDSMCVDPWEFHSDKVEQETTLYAKWSQLHTISFYIPTGDLSLPPEEQTYELFIQSSVKQGGSLASPPEPPLRDGYRGVWDRASFDNITTDLDVYAQYTPQTYTVQFIDTDLTTGTQVVLHTITDVPHGTRFYEVYADEIARIPQPERAHSTFTGWQVNDGTALAELIVEGPVTLVATFRVNDSTVRFHYNLPASYTTTEPEPTIHVSYGTPIHSNPDEPVPDDPEFATLCPDATEKFQFTGWYADPEGLSPWNREINTVNTEEQHLYAGWVQMFTVTFLCYDPTVDVETPAEGFPQTREVRSGGVLQFDDVPPIPEFAGWDGEWENSATLFMPVMSDFEVRVIYTYRTFTVRFLMTNGDPIGDPQTVPYGDTLAAYLPAEETLPEQVGYHFDHWSAGETEVNETTQVTSDLDVLAIYQENIYTVTYVDRTGNGSATVEARHGELLIQPTAPTAPNTDRYVFDGWYREETYEHKWDFSNDVVTEDLTLYAKYDGLYTVRFVVYVEDMHEVSETLKEIKGLRSGSYLTEDQLPPFPVDKEYDQEWRDEDDQVLNLDNPIDKDYTYHPVRTDAITYYVRFYVAGNMVAEQKYAYLNGVHILTAEELEEMNQEAIEYNREHPEDPHNLVIPEGQRFVGWSPTPPAEGTAVETDLNFYATLTPKTYTVLFVDEGYRDNIENPEAHVYDRQLVEHGSSAVNPTTNVPDAPWQTTKEGMRFTGWREMTTGATSYTTITSDCVFQAQYQTIRFTVYFRDRATNYEYGRKEFNYGDMVKFDELQPMKEGYDFKGWGDGYLGQCLQDMVVYATWEIKHLPVTFMENGGSDVDDAVVDYGQYLNEPEAPTRDGMAFLGWYTDEECTLRYRFYQQPVRAEFTLYAGWADFEQGSDGVSYRLLADGSGYEVVNADAFTNQEGITHLSIENYHNNLPVTAIGSGAFRDHVYLQAISIPEGVTVISPNAFLGCTALRVTCVMHVTIEGDGETRAYEEHDAFVLPASVERVEANAFRGCTALQTVRTAALSKLVSIGEYAFADCKALSAITLPQGVQQLGDGAFRGCAALSSLTLPDSVETLGAALFAECTHLKYVTLTGTTPPRMAVNAFSDTSDTLHVYVPDLDVYRAPGLSAGWADVRDKLYLKDNIVRDFSGADLWAYSFNPAHTGVVLVQYLGNDAAITIPESLTIEGTPYPVVQVGAFVFDASVEGVTLNSDLNVHVDALAGALALTRLDIRVQSEVHESLSPLLVHIFATLPGLHTLGVTGTPVGGDVVTLRSLFNGEPPAALTHVVVLIPQGSSTATVGEGMFENCPLLQSVTLEAGITAIGANAFRGDLMLQNLIIQQAEGGYVLASIGDGAFEGCRALADVTIPQSVTQVGRGAFVGTAYWQSVQAEQGYLVIGDGILYAYFGSEVVLRAPNTVKSVAPYAFQGNTRILGVVFDPTQSALQTVGAYAFADAVNLEYIVLPTALRRVENGAFAGAEKLHKFVVFAADLSWENFASDAWPTMADDDPVYVFSASGNAGAPADIQLAYDLQLRVNGNWIYYDDGTRRVVQYMGSYTPGEELNLQVVSEWAKVEAYAFPRATTSLEMHSTLTLNENVFGGLTRLTRLTIRNTGGQPGNGPIYAALFRANPDLHRVEIGGAYGPNNVNTRLIDTLYELLGDYQPGLQAVTILDGTTSLADRVFYGFTNLSEITFPDTLEKVGVNAFTGTRWLAEWPEEFVVILDGLLVAYKGQDKLITLPQGVKAVNAGTFNGNDNLEVLVLDHPVRMGENAFANTPALNLVWVTTPEAMPEIETKDGNPVQVFNGAGNRAATLYLSGQTVGSVAWWTRTVSNDQLVYLDLMAGGATLAQQIALAVVQDNRATLVKYLLSSDYGAAYPDSAAETARLLRGSSVTDASFAVAGSAVDVTAIGSNAVWASTNLLGISLKTTLDATALTNITDLTELILKDTMGDTEARKLDASIVNELFRNNPGLYRLSYAGDAQLSEVLGSAPAAITQVQILSNGSARQRLTNYALRRFSSVTSVILPVTITDAGVYALEDTAWFRQQGSFVVFPSGLLYKCRQTNLRNPSVPATVTEIGSFAFTTFSATTQVWQGGDLETPATSNGTWSGASAINEVQFTVGSAVRAIRAYAFYALNNLTYLDAPETLVSADPLAFSGTRIQYNEEGVMAFSGAGSDGSVIVAYRAPAGASGVQLHVGGQYKRVLSRAFYGATALEQLIFDDTPLAAVTLCDYAFAGCSGLTRIVFHNKVTGFGAGTFEGVPAAAQWMMRSAGADGGETSLKRTQDGSGAERGDYVVVNGTLLRFFGGYTDTWELPADVSVIAAGAFEPVGAESGARVGNLVIRATLPPTVSPNALDYVSGVQVPAEALDVYKAAWTGAYAEKLSALD